MVLWLDSPNQRAYQGMATVRAASVRSALVALLFAAVTVGGFVCTRYLVFTADFVERKFFRESNLAPGKPSRTKSFTLNCSRGNLTGICPGNYYPTGHVSVNLSMSSTSSPSCPDYFHWIHEDLWPWRKSGITREMLISARPQADFRLVILNGRAYVETYRKAFQTRDTFTLWGILQLLRRSPGKVPDLDLMFECGDLPVIMKENFTIQAVAPPPLFRYCGDNQSFNIVFPDWSFWGWPEINIKPWEKLSKDLEEGNRRMKWRDRAPYAYWKGNTYVSQTRYNLLKCDVSRGQDWNARIYTQDWLKEIEGGFKNSNLANQCIHRYKIFVEGRTWSVSDKYILACDSITLIIRPHFYDFFTRSLVPLQHYWPINDTDICRSIKHAVDWGNRHPKEAQAIGKAGSRFVLDELKMELVYDYMLHLLNEYAKLLRYKPTVPENGVELCSEAMACGAEGLEKKFMVESMVKGPTVSQPCAMPPPLDPASFRSVVEREYSGIKRVEDWEREYWESHKEKMQQ